MNFKLLQKGFNHFVIKRCSPYFWQMNHWLNETERKSLDELQEIQLVLFKRLIKHSYLTVPFYKNMMDNVGMIPDDVKSLDDIKHFPIINKNNIISANEAVYSNKYHRMILRSAYTGGTTGTPLTIKRDIISIARNHAFYYRQKKWGGMKIHERCAYLTGNLIFDPNDQGKCLYAYDPFMKELILSTYHLTKKTAENYAEIIKKKNISYLDGYPSAIQYLAKICIDLKIDLQLKSVFTSSETMNSIVKETIERAFKCQVYDYYGSAERSVIIHTCERGSYHIIPEYGITELIPSKDGEKNKYKLISTGFWNYSMPFIRYDMDDYVIKSNRTCSCGRNYIVIDAIVGRNGDVLKTISGREYGTAILTHLLYGANNILESQIIQDGLSHIYIDYVPGELFKKEDYLSWNLLVKKHLPNEIRVDFREVKAVQRTSSGKIKPVISLLK